MSEKILCKCGCGTELTGRTTLWRVRTGRDNAGFVKGHHVRGARNAKWNGGRSSKDGYILVWSPDHPNARKSGYILEHRFVMSEYLGRPLLDSEVVHHVNHNRSDNRLENLELMSESVHARQHAEDPNHCNRKPLQPKICPTCGKAFIKPWRGNHQRDLACSRQCSVKDMPKGSAHHAAKLTDDLVRRMRELRSKGLSHQAIADTLGVQRRNVGRVLDGTRWKHVV